MCKFHKSYSHTFVLAILLMITEGQAQAAEAGDFLFRTRVITLSPNDSTGPVSGIAGTEAGVNSDTTLEVDFTYVWSKKFRLELILATTEHQVTGVKGAVDGADIGTVKLLPPTLTAQYHFRPDAGIRPYVGAGINYTLFYDEKAGAGLGSGASVDYDDSFGLVAQGGVDIGISKDWYINVDVKYITVDTTLTVTGGSVPGTTDVTLDPWVFGIGVGTSF